MAAAVAAGGFGARRQDSRIQPTGTGPTQPGLLPMVRWESCQQKGHCRRMGGAQEADRVSGWPRSPWQGSSLARGIRRLSRFPTRGFSTEACGTHPNWLVHRTPRSTAVHSFPVLPPLFTPQFQELGFCFSPFPRKLSYKTTNNTGLLIYTHVHMWPTSPVRGSFQQDHQRGRVW